MTSETNKWVTILTGSPPVAEGNVRQVWNRPEHPNQLLKTIRSRKRRKYESRNIVLRAIDNLRLGPYATFKVEYQCYIQTAYRCAKASRPNPIAEIGGLVLTDHGLAQVCEKVTDSSGQLAKTLEALLADRALDAHRVQLLNELAETLFSLNVNVPDLRPLNIVLDEVKNRFVVIDGYGDKTVFPVRAWFKSLNQSQLNSRFAQMAIKGVLEWDPAQKKFSLI